MARARIADRVVAVVLLAAALLAAVPESSVAAASAAATLDDFYVVPAPLAAGAPGELIRFEPVASDTEQVTVRIMYHSRDRSGRDRAVTGIVTYPTAPPPPGGWPVIATAPGTSGLVSPCATSRSGAPAPTFGLTAVGVRTDYIGLGPIGEIQPYLSRVSEAHAVIDAVRAARNLPGTGAGDRWLVVGHSQGGHAALAAHELGEVYAPELELLGAVPIAPGAMLDRVYNPIDRIVANIVGVMALYGAPSEYPEIDPLDYVGPQTAAVAASVLTTDCLDTIISAFLSVPPDQFYVNDPAQTEPARSILLANDVGNVAVETPVLLVQGTSDAIVFPARTYDLLARLCEHGQVTEYAEYAGADHNTVVPAAHERIATWLAARLAGMPAVDSCSAAPPVAVPVVTTPTFTG